jgi:CHAT domain-containing protein
MLAGSRTTTELREREAALDALASTASTAQARAWAMGQLGSLLLERGRATDALRRFEQGLTELHAVEGPESRSPSGKMWNGAPTSALLTALPIMSHEEPGPTELLFRLELGAAVAYAHLGQVEVASRWVDALCGADSPPSPQALALALYVRSALPLTPHGDWERSVEARLARLTLLDRAAALCPRELDSVLSARIGLAQALAALPGALSGAIERVVRALIDVQHTERGREPGLGAGVWGGHVLPAFGEFSARLAGFSSSIAAAGAPGQSALELGALGATLLALGEPRQAVAPLRAAVETRGLEAGHHRTEQGRVSLGDASAPLIDRLVDALLASGDAEDALRSAESARGAALRLAIAGEDNAAFAAVVPRIVYHATPHRTVLFYLDEAGRTHLALSPLGSAELRSHIDALYGGFGLRSGLRGAEVADLGASAPMLTRESQPPNTASALLYAHLVAPFAHLLPADGEMLHIGPDGPLWALPFATLAPDPEALPLGVRFSLMISVSPSVTAQLRAQPADPLASDTVLVGNPVMPAGLPALPGAEREARLLGDMLGIEPLLGADATVARVRAAVTSARVVHLATHAGVDGPGGEFESLGPWIALSPERRTPRKPAAASSLAHSGMWSLADISGSTLDSPVQLAPAHSAEPWLRAELVVLSACQSAAGESAEEGTIGLCRAFLAAGARTVVASLFSVDDAHTCDLMVAFHAARLRGLGPAHALRAAMEVARQTHPHPASWAAFIVMGAGTLPTSVADPDPEDGPHERPSEFLKAAHL